MEDGKMLLIEDVMDRLHVKRPYVYQLIETGQLRASKVARRWLIAETSLEEYLQGTQQQKSDSPARRKKLGLTLDQMKATNRENAHSFLQAQTDADRWKCREEMWQCEKMAGRQFGFPAMDEVHAAALSVIYPNRKGK